MCNRLFFMKYLVWMLLLLGMVRCVSVRQNIDLSYKTGTAWSGYEHPRFLEGILTLTIKQIHLLSGDSLKADNRAHGIPEMQPPTLLVWSPVIHAFPSQRNVQHLAIQPEPTHRFVDAENGNPIWFWDLSAELAANDSLTIQRHFSYIIYDYRPLVAADSLPPSEAKIPDSIQTFYTKSEPFLQASDSLTRLAREITKGLDRPLPQTRALHRWVHQNMAYTYPPEARGAQNALHTLRGDCGQYAALFIALARSLHIPARQQSGFVFSSERISYHVWAEVYFAGSGWFPVDPTRANGFGFLDNRRLIASAGNNIPLLFAPDWATYANSEVEQGRTPFMQMATIVKNGFKADIRTDLHICRDYLLE